MRFWLLSGDGGACLGLAFGTQRFLTFRFWGTLPRAMERTIGAGVEVQVFSEQTNTAATLSYKLGLHAG